LLANGAIAEADATFASKAALAHLGSGILLRSTSSIHGLACASRHKHILCKLAPTRAVIQSICPPAAPLLAGGASEKALHAGNTYRKFAVRV
jgi:hypothetical protein